ncbi:hypothetical protein [Paludisphaera mucosa]|uniref:Uncharacterized protein n=1 Tax=Paludisphaera mucosa TaxID=3030827 RepID=A0ABT6FB68_9BACT|nr:hypothetical protein [Paludisphaera mucosa]MDG3004833.1 hypothetical protein [Paludisphaera mucosa]
MSSRHYHTPPPTITTRLQCPVCHKSVYSRAGIHPQCAVRLDDPPRPKPKRPGEPVVADIVDPVVDSIAVSPAVAGRLASV